MTQQKRGEAAAKSGAGGKSGGGAWREHKPTALLVLADGTVIEGAGLGAKGSAVAEVCFNTAMTG